MVYQAKDIHCGKPDKGQAEKLLVLNDGLLYCQSKGGKENTCIKSHIPVAVPIFK